MTWPDIALRAIFLAGLLFAVGLSGRILFAYVRLALRGSREARWLGQHITAIAASHLLLLLWATGRFVVAGEDWGWGWTLGLGIVLTLSDYGVWQIHRYRRWRDRRQG